MIDRVATVPPRSRRSFPPIATAADLRAALAREAVVQAATGEPADLADDFGAVCYPCSVAAALGATLARAGRALADVVRMEALTYDPAAGALEVDDVERCSLRAFVIANVEAGSEVADRPLWCDAVALPVGGSFTVGGGAAPFFRNTREARR